MNLKFFLPGIVLLFSTVLVYGQDNPNSILSKGLKYRFDEQSTLSFHFGTQVWARYMDPNPGSIDVDGAPVDAYYDFGLRRTRISMYASFLEDKFVVYTQLGMNGQSFSSVKSPQIYFHDVWSAFNLVRGKLYAGMGLHGWSGVSRLGSVSYNKNIMLDHPGFGLPNLGKTDQAGRQIGAFIKGNLAGFNYRFSLDKPFVADESSAMGIDQSAYFPTSRMAYKGYVFYSFLDQEIFKSSYIGLSYLGSKKILNLGAGFDIHPELMASIDPAGDTILHDKRLFGIDVFLDYPFDNSSVLTLYSALYLYDFGPNYVRTYGVMNPLKNGTLQQGGGNAHYNVGTGNIVYTVLGYILPDKLQPFSGRFQPVVAMHYKDFDALGESSLQWDFGLNYYISGHNAKINFQYSNWAVYSGSPGNESTASISEYKNMMVFQVQMYL